MTQDFATCAQTKTTAVLADGWFVADTKTGEWSFQGYEVPDPGGHTYSVNFQELVKSPASLVDWLAHLYEKIWFQPDKFFRAMHDLRGNVHQTTRSHRG